MTHEDAEEIIEYIFYKIAFVDFKNSPKETQKKMLDKWGSKLNKEHLVEFMSIYNSNTKEQMFPQGYGLDTLDQHIKQNEVLYAQPDR